MKIYVTIAAFFVLLSCSTAITAHADTVPWLTGDFQLFGNGNYGTGDNFVAFTPPPPIGLFVFSPPPNLPNSTFCVSPPIEGWNCVTTWNGNAFGGSVAFLDVKLNEGDPALTFSGWMSGGQITGGRWTDCIGSCGDQYNQWSFDFTFRGVWSNGWWSEGSANAIIPSVGETDASLQMTTFTTPEPGTLLMLASGILGLGGIARKRLFR